MAKNILIFSDGTGQAGGLRPDQALSNVYKLYRATRTGVDSSIDPSKQVSFYSEGLGSGEKETFLSHPIKAVRKLLNATMGTGITENITDCYEAILKYYEEGDHIYLFGFSRGAYTVRGVAGVISLCGIPTYNQEGNQPIPRSGRKLRVICEEAISVYQHGASKERDTYESERQVLAERFREKYVSFENKDNQKSNAAPYFIGLFDTVAALGARGLKQMVRSLLMLIGIGFLVAGVAVLFNWLTAMPWLYNSIAAFVVIVVALTFDTYKRKLKIIHRYPHQEGGKYFYRDKDGLGFKKNFNWHIVAWRFQFFDQYLDNRVCYARHALSIDEQRSDFLRVPWGIKGDRSAHIDSGRKAEWFKQVWFSGNHSDIGGSYAETESRLSDTSLKWMVEQLNEVHDSNPITIQNEKLFLFPDALGKQHSEIFSLKNKFPKWWPKSMRFAWQRKIRPIPNDAPLHPSVIERFKAEHVQQSDQLAAYRPVNLKNHEDVKSFFRG